MSLSIKIFKTIVVGLFFLSNANAQEFKYPKNEFRAVWIATVANIDWPKQRTDSVAKQQKDFIEILDIYKKINYNAVIVQVRSVGDAFYETQLAPWSRFLTGKEGQAPKTNIDILAWMIQESHNRGFEFHAWFNPYRATSDLNLRNLAENHDFNLHRDWMIKYGDKYYYNPGLPEVEAHLIKIVEEVVQNYDIDAVHFDDYFYPYRIFKVEFNDKMAFEKYGNGLILDDWRRNNVNNLVQKLNLAIKKIKPFVQFGISPFGVWRNKSSDEKGSDTRAGQTNYDDLFADTKLWDKNKWIDYIIPQLYWSLNHPKASHSKLLKWWSENSKNVALYIGNGSYKIKNDPDKHWNNELEIPNQIDSARTYKNISGNAFFSAKSFIYKNKTVTDYLIANQFKYKSIPTVVPNFKKIINASPIVESIEKTAEFYILKLPMYNIRYLVLYASNDKKNLNKNDVSQMVDKYYVNYIDGFAEVKIPLDLINTKNNFGITFIDFYGNESELNQIILN
jgi:uncharacterized lipoprotein YddW (UPF0748 family)